MTNFVLVCPAILEAFAVRTNFEVFLVAFDEAFEK